MSVTQNNPAVSERAQLETELAQGRIQLEKLRIQEPSLRCSLAASLERLEYESRRAAFKIGTNEWRDGHACMDVHFDRVKDAESALIELLDQIALAERETEDAQNTLNDASLWEAA